jgi:hypothetical protein
VQQGDNHLVNKRDILLFRFSASDFFCTGSSQALTRYLKAFLRILLQIQGDIRDYLIDSLLLFTAES